MGRTAGARPRIREPLPAEWVTSIDLRSWDRRAGVGRHSKRRGRPRAFPWQRSPERC